MLVKYFAEAVGAMAVLASPCLIGEAVVYIAALRMKR